MSEPLLQDIEDGGEPVCDVSFYTSNPWKLTEKLRNVICSASNHKTGDGQHIMRDVWVSNGADNVDVPAIKPRVGQKRIVQYERPFSVPLRGTSTTRMEEVHVVAASDKEAGFWLKTSCAALDAPYAEALRTVLHWKVIPEGNSHVRFVVFADVFFVRNVAFKKAIRTATFKGAVASFIPLEALARDYLSRLEREVVAAAKSQGAGPAVAPPGASGTSGRVKKSRGRTKSRRSRGSSSTRQQSHAQAADTGAAAADGREAASGIDVAGVDQDSVSVAHSGTFDRPESTRFDVSGGLSSCPNTPGTSAIDLTGGLTSGMGVLGLPATTPVIHLGPSYTVISKLWLQTVLAANIVLIGWCVWLTAIVTGYAKPNLSVPVHH